MSQCTISCELHDYLEIACMNGYRVKLALKDHRSIEGKALDIITAEKREYLVIDDGREQQQVELNLLAKM